MMTIEKADILSRVPELIALKYDPKGIFLVDLRIHGRKIEVICDSDSGLTVDDCTDITRYLQFHIDHEELFDGHYTLEVSSPGIDRGLKLPRQYKRNVGRTVTVTTAAGRHDGTLVLVDPHGIMIQPKQGGSKKEPEKPLMRFLWKDIQLTRVWALTNQNV